MRSLFFSARLAALPLLVVFCIPGCSLSGFDRTSCATDDDCVAFGATAVCVADGYCDAEAIGCENDDACIAELGEGATCGGDGACVPPPGCASNAQCRAENGFGSVCTEGACAPVTPHPRCLVTYPDNLYARSGELSLVAGNLMDRSLATHVARENSAQLAFRQANDEGGLEGDVGIILCTIEADTAFDELTRREAAEEVAVWLADEVGVPAIVGPAASGDTQAVFEAVRPYGTLIISPSATSPALGAIDVLSPTDATPGLLWRTAPPDSLQGAILAQDLSARGVDSVAVIYESGAYGEGLLQIFIDAYGALGGTIEGTALVFDADNASQRDERIALAATSAATELLFISSQTQDAIALTAIAGSGAAFDGKSLLFTDAAGNNDFLAAFPASLAGRVRGTRPAPIDGFVYTAFLAAYAGAYGGENAADFSFTAQAYDAAWLVLYGAAFATYQEDAVFGTNIARGLRQLSSGAPSQLVGSSWAGAKNALRMGSSIDVQGASGALDYDPATEETAAEIEVWSPTDCAGTIELRATATPGDPIVCD